MYEYPQLSRHVLYQSCHINFAMHTTMTWNNACQKRLCRCAICILGVSLVQPLICHHSNDAKWIVGGSGRGQPLLPLGEWLNSIGKNGPSKTVRCRRLVKFEIWKENVSRLDKKFGNEHKLWRSVVEIMAIGSVESKMYFLLWPRTRLSNPLSSKPSSIKQAWIWIKSAAAPLPLLRTPPYLDTYLFALLCHPCFTFTPHPWPPLNFPFKVTGHGGFVLFALFQITKFQ